jgi:hypothetical protein
MKGSCGEMAGAMVDREFVTTFPIDDRYLAPLRQKMAARNACPNPAAHQILRLCGHFGGKTGIQDDMAA